MFASFLAPALRGQQAFTWEQIRQRFEQSNPTLRAAQMNVDEARASEITAYLRPNPDFTATVDQLDPITPNPYRPLTNTLPLVSGSYLHERANKRELRRDSARQATGIAEVNVIDTERTLLFTLRNAFVQALQAKAVLQLANENLSYYDNLLRLNRDRYSAGDIAQIDVERLELQRVQYLTDVTNATVSVRTAKIQLLQLLNDRTPVEQFDIAGPFDFSDRMQPLEELRNIALDARPDLKAALRTVEKAQTDHKLAIANGSVDPTFGMDVGRNPPISAYFGFNVTIPLRIFDRNQGEKARTQIDIQRSERLREATQAQVFSDVDSAYATLMGTLNLLRPYKATYLAQAERIRETVSFMYERGAASLLDFLNAQNDYRTTQLNYRNLLGSFLTAANQLNLAVGREVVQ
ncbi:MAG TPA: TolC family protein [Bryobacteraceae bacterium]|nr:TolC family protein [Bryobacteraceae bacterium]